MKYLYIAIAVLTLASCEDVVDIPLTESPKRLVIDANINWRKDESGKSLGNIQKIKLTETTGFYETSIPVATGALVTITNTSNDSIYTFEEETETPGIYATDTFVPEINATYALNISYKGEEFTAEEKMLPVADIDSISQSIVNVFGNDFTRVDFHFTDPIEEGNFYVNQINFESEYITDNYRTYGDEVVNGNPNSVFIQDENLEPEDEIILYFYGVSERYHNYLSLLLQQITSGGPFGTPPAPVKGNCINTTNPENKPLGYFRLSEMYVSSYVVE
ncbi:MAG: DUF4249 family protein [Flavicella sp.]